MSQVMLLHDNQFDRAAISASSAVASMPVTNLQDPQRTIVWRSTAAGTQTIDITLAAGEGQVQAFALVDHNLSLAGSVRLQAWSDALDGADQVMDTTYQPYQPTYGYGELLYGEGLYGGYDIFFNGYSIADVRTVLRPILMTQILPAQTVRYWRVTITDISLLYHQAGRVFLGPAWQPTVNFSWGSNKAREQRTRRVTARGGQYYGNPRTGRTQLQFNLDWLDDADRDRLWITYMLQGRDTPFILIMRPVGGYEQESSSYYGVFDQFSLRQAFLNNAAAPIAFEEVL